MINASSAVHYSRKALNRTKNPQEDIMKEHKISKTWGLILVIIQLFTILLIPGYVFAAGGTLIHSDFDLGVNGGNFDVVVQEGDRVCHYWRNNDEQPFLWHKTECFASNVTSAPALIQSDFNAGINGGNFEVVVRQGNQLCHWYRNNDKEPFVWRRTTCFASNVTSAPTLIQSSFLGEGVDMGSLIYSCITDWGCGENASTRNDLNCSYLTNYEQCMQKVNDDCAKVRRDCEASIRGLDLAPRANFEVVVQQGGRLCHWWRNNDKPPYVWRQTYCFN
jgi:hypothetical protein